jgi:RimJ/RimL family protein N-acetyltransferase
MSFIFKPLDEASIYELVSWRYKPPYDIYNLRKPDEEDLKFLLDPLNGYYSISNDAGELVAFCCFGLDGQVPGGDYSAEALDIGLGVRPDLTGQGRGIGFVKAVLEFARQKFTPPVFRVTVAEFNRRAQRVWQRVGFRPVQTFGRGEDKLDFVVLVRESDNHRLF